MGTYTFLSILIAILSIRIFFSYAFSFFIFLSHIQYVCMCRSCLLVSLSAFNFSPKDFFIQIRVCASGCVYMLCQSLLQAKGRSGNQMEVMFIRQKLEGG